MNAIDLCADLGEGFLQDAELLPLLTSVSIGCGQHAGSIEHSAATLELAQRHRVVIGAHPGYPDLANLGRANFDFADNGVANLTYQLGGLIGLAELYEVEVSYLKLHGAWYHKAMTDLETAQVVLNVAMLFDLALVGLPNSVLEAEAKKAEWDFIREGYIDRKQNSDGSLVSRDQADAFLNTPEQAVEQIEQLVQLHQVQMFCIHGDRSEAVTLLRGVWECLSAKGYQFAPVLCD